MPKHCATATQQCHWWNNPFLKHFLQSTSLLMIVLSASLFQSNLVSALSSSSSTSTSKFSPTIHRRDVLFASSSAALASLTAPHIVNAASSIAITNNNGGLAAKLSKRDPSALKNSVFNVPPAAQTYPPFMHGTWDISLKFRGYIFPSQKIPKEKLLSNFAIPGFQKCSIAALCDVGRDITSYQMKIDPATGKEDRAFTLTNSVNAHLGYDAIRSISYDGNVNPNRLSLDFIPNRTRNANRIELFCNARESELVEAPPTPSETTEGKDSDVATKGGRKIFVCSEYIRQVTFGLSQEFGVARQVVGNYAHFWTWREQSSAETMTGNLLTAVYLDPQDSMFFEEPSKPVAVYSHDIVAKRVSL